MTGRPRKVFATVSEERVHDSELELARLLRLVKRQVTRRKRLTTAIRENRIKIARAQERLAESKRAHAAVLELRAKRDAIVGEP